MRVPKPTPARSGQRTPSAALPGSAAQVASHSPTPHRPLWRALSLSLGLTLSLSLVGCDTDTAGSASGGEVIYATSVAGEDFAQSGEGQVIEAFRKAHPDIKVTVEQTPLGEYNTKLITQFRSGKGPDIGRVNHTDIQTFAAGGFLRPLESAISSQNIDIDTLIPGLVDVGVVDGTQVTLPLGTDARVLYYSPKLLAEKGVTEPPRTWDQLLDAVGKFSDAQTTGVYGYGFPTDNDYSLSYEAIGPYLKAAGGELVSSDTPPQAIAATSEGAIAAVQLLQDIVNTGAVPAGVGNTSGDTIGQLMSQGKLAMMLGGPWSKSSLVNNNPDLVYGTDYATAAVPTPTAGEPSGSAAGGWQIGLFAKGTHDPAAAEQLLAFMMEKDNLVLLNKNEAFPPLKDGLSLEPWASDPFFEAFNEVLPRAGLPIAPVPQLAEVSAVFERSIEPVLVDPTKSVKQALAEFDKRINTEVLR